ncbi:hypothetical protein VNO77_17778 [Canavalia gladiata]|uniref:FAD/NAD(P)-binding domain-containing protein n=1 Tax=Canavalia gladiata TaxID=3824 RepID=A0AAN9LJL8_CANGL
MFVQVAKHIFFSECKYSVYIWIQANKGVKLIKGTVAVGFTANSGGEVKEITLKDVKVIEVDFVVVGAGGRSQATLFKWQVEAEKGRIMTDYLKTNMPHDAGEVATVP